MANFPMVETDFKPTGPLGGWYAGENAAYQEQMQPMMLLDQLYKNQNQNLQNDRYAALTPNEILKSNLEGAQSAAQNTPAGLQAFVQGKEGLYFMPFFFKYDCNNSSKYANVIRSNGFVRLVLTL